MRVVGYTRVSTEEQASSGAGLQAQEAVITASATRSGHELVGLFTDEGVSGKALRGRPGLTQALEHVETGQADGLIVAKLDRLSRSMLDFAALMERSQRHGWALIALDLGVDTSTPAGELVAHVMASVAQWERRAIGARTREALAAKKAQGVQLGRPATMPADVRARIVKAREDGQTLATIAASLNADHVATAQGGSRWWPSTIAAVLAR